jgi:hypothetical protein
LNVSKNVRFDLDGRQMNPQDGHFIRRFPDRVRIGAKKNGS